MRARRWSLVQVAPVENNAWARRARARVADETGVAMIRESVTHLTCPKCGKQVVVAVARNSVPGPDDRVRCPTHGDIGRFQDVKAAASKA
jgi:hypothetical protein